MVPAEDTIAFPMSDQSKAYLTSTEFKEEVVEKLKSQYDVGVSVREHQGEQEDVNGSTSGNEYHLVFSYTKANAGAAQDAHQHLNECLVAHGVQSEAIKGHVPRPKSDSFEDAFPYFPSKLLQQTEPPVMTNSPTRSHFGDDAAEGRGLLGRLKKPGSVSSITSLNFLDRKNGTNSPGAFYKQASSNASKASFASINSESSLRNPWNDSGINLPDDEQHSNGYGNGWSSGAAVVRHAPYESKFPYGANGNGSTSAFSTHSTSGAPGDTTPTSKHETRPSFDSGRPSTANSANVPSSGYPGPIGPPR